MSASQAECRGFESHRPLIKNGRVVQWYERFVDIEEVAGSIPAAPIFILLQPFLSLNRGAFF